MNKFETAAIIAKTLNEGLRYHYEIRILNENGCGSELISLEEFEVLCLDLADEAVEALSPTQDSRRPIDLNMQIMEYVMNHARTIGETYDDARINFAMPTTQGEAFRICMAGDLVIDLEYINNFLGL
jgi:hypothetical protein